MDANRWYIVMKNRNNGPRLVLGGKCVNGHTMTQSNLYSYPDGRTACRDCYIGQRAASRGRPRMYDRPDGVLPPLKGQVNLPKLKFMGEVSDD